LGFDIEGSGIALQLHNSNLYAILIVMAQKAKTLRKSLQENLGNKKPKS
jgi:hypothetical protein